MHALIHVSGFSNTQRNVVAFIVITRLTYLTSRCVLRVAFLFYSICASHFRIHITYTYFIALYDTLNKCSWVYTWLWYYWVYDWLWYFGALLLVVWRVGGCLAYAVFKVIFFSYSKMDKRGNKKQKEEREGEEKEGEKKEHRKKREKK